MFMADRWQDFELIDAGDGEKLERWGDIILQRPDPQAIWPHEPWDHPHAVYHRSTSGGGYWQKFREHPATWSIQYPFWPESGVEQLTFHIEPTGFKHTGLFPEQATNWDFFTRQIQAARRKGRTVRILNLFAYTGGATVACAAAGADEVVHLDASKGMNAKARENLVLSGLQDRHVRFFTDDVQKFVERELRRGRQYDGIIMDPPSYGRGPAGELWKLEDALYGLVKRSAELLSPQALFFVINSYTTGLAPTVLADILGLVIKPEHGGITSAEELGLKATARDLILPCGCTGRWQP